jgi:hypothetical protein
VSALDHILGGQQTMPTDKGLILEETGQAPPGEASSARRAGLMGEPRSRAKEQRRYLEVSMLQSSVSSGNFAMARWPCSSTTL